MLWVLRVSLPGELGGGEGPAATRGAMGLEGGRGGAAATRGAIVCWGCCAARLLILSSTMQASGGHQE